MPHPPLLLPPEPNRPDGAPRRVGVEIEFSGLELAAAAGLVRGLYGGTLVNEDPHRMSVRGTVLGDFRVELDLSVAHPAEKPAGAPVDGPVDRIEKRLRSAVGDLGRAVMPFEVACPPIPMADLGALEPLVLALRRSGAQGTEGHLFSAFGLHFNPEVGRRDADSVLDLVKAYLLLSPWLRTEMGIDLARRALPWVQRFPQVFIDRVVAPAYRPDLTRFTIDYVRASPTRNRELDLHPLLAWLVPGVWRAVGRDPLVKPRPTWHWRLPDSRVGETGWSILPDWNRWVQVERLASDRWTLDELGGLWRDCRLAGAEADWPRAVGRWLAPE